MQNKHQVHNLIILDESGSMSSIKTSTIQGFNELIQTIKGIEHKFPDQDHVVTFVSFNSLHENLLHFVEPVSKLTPLDQNSYKPNSNTPLLDTMGNIITKLKNHLQHESDYNVLVTILTDGEENSSKEYSQASIKNLVEELQQKNWTFTYIGTDHNVEAVAQSLNIPNFLKFEKNEEDMKNMFVKENNARMVYCLKIEEREFNLSEDYFRKPINDTTENTPVNNKNKSK
ncbi:MAG: VWA domain-containing protein, partial [Sediminibacterium sp.]|nr:VWA domain-containing protein [Sediminibacterium sp.]